MLQIKIRLHRRETTGRWQSCELDCAIGAKKILRVLQNDSSWIIEPGDSNFEIKQKRFAVFYVGSFI